MCVVARRTPHPRLSALAEARACSAAPVSAAVVVRAPYQWTPATRSRSAFIHDGRVNGVGTGRPRSPAAAAAAPVASPTCAGKWRGRRRDDRGRRAKSAVSTSDVMPTSRCGGSRERGFQARAWRGRGGSSPRARHPPRRAALRHATPPSDLQP